MSNKIYVRSGVISSGMILSETTSCFVYSGGTILDTQIGGAAQATLLGGSASATHVSGEGNFTIRQNAIAVDTVVESGGKMRISGGATASNTVFLAGGSGSISANLQDAVLSSGAQLSVASGANITGLRIESGGIMQLTVAKGIAISGVSAGIPLVVSGGVISSYVLESGNQLTLCTGASACDIGIGSGAALYASNGVFLSGVHIDQEADGCNYELDSKSMFLDCDYGGRMFSMQDGLLSGLYVNEKGNLILSSGVIAEDIAFHGSELTVSEGAIVRNSYINGGSEDMSGVISNCTLGSSAYIGMTGGTVTDVTLESGGRLYAVGTLTGTIRIGGTLYLKNDTKTTSDAVLEFDISGRTASTKPIVSAFQYAAFGDYNLITAAKQGVGNYTLANRVTSFTGSISVSADESYLGELVIGGSSLFTRSGEYSLLLDANACMILSITQAPDTVYVNDNWDDLPNGTELEIDSGTSAVIGYDAFATYQTAMQHVAYGGKVLNRGSEIPVFANDLVEITIQDDCYVTGNDPTIDKVVTVGVIYCGIGAETPEDKELTIDNTTARRIVVGGNFGEIDQTATEGEVQDYATISATISGSTFAKGLIGGINAYRSTVYANTDITVSKSNANLFFGGANITAGTAEAGNNVTINGNNSLILTDCISTTYVNGGSLIASYGNETKNGDITLNIVGGTHKQVNGGSLIQSNAGVTEGLLGSTIHGDISISISGGAQVTNLYGGSGALKVAATSTMSVDGNVSVTLDLASGAKVSDMLCVGGIAKASVDGNTTLTITGSGTGSDFLSTKKILGDTSYAKGDITYVEGERNLKFANFSGTVTSAILYFDTIELDGKSQVSFVYAFSQFASKNWTISADSASNVSVYLPSNNLPAGNDETYSYDLSFASSELNFNCVLGEEDEWVIFKIANDEDGKAFIGLSDAKINLNGDNLSEEQENLFIGENYQLEYRTEEIGGVTYGMLVASKLQLQQESEVILTELA